MKKQVGTEPRNMDMITFIRNKYEEPSGKDWNIMDYFWKEFVVNNNVLERLVVGWVYVDQ